MNGNFDPELSGIKLQLTKLMKMTQLTLPNLYKHLIKCQSEGLYFFFRHILLQFKRELRWEQVLQLWEVIWTDYYTTDFQLFFAYVNKLLVRAEILYKLYDRMSYIVD
ncbi:TBC domain [Mycobacteroides abscessus subsp. abscessus]|nr:TBC domain [Mycobacteroides abscessus subsp. abscessus]